MIDAHHETAKASGARIVFSCGFDSIPFDLGVQSLQECAVAKHGVPAPRVKGRVRKMQGGFSGGTAASLKATLAAAARHPSIVALLTNPFALTPGFSGPHQPMGLLPEYDGTIGAWVAPFIMAAINTKNVHRTNFLLGQAYGKNFVYDEMMVAGLGDVGRAAAEAISKLNPLASDKGPKPGEGTVEGGPRQRILQPAVRGTDARRVADGLRRHRRPRPRLWIDQQDDRGDGLVPAGGRRAVGGHLDAGCAAGRDAPAPAGGQGRADIPGGVGPRRPHPSVASPRHPCASGRGKDAEGGEG